MNAGTKSILGGYFSTSLLIATAFLSNACGLLLDDELDSEPSYSYTSSGGTSGDPRVPTMSNGEPAIVYYAAMGNQAKVQELIAQRVDLEATNSSGDTAMVAAARAGEVGIIIALGNAGANPDAKTNYSGSTIIRSIVREGGADVFWGASVEDDFAVLSFLVLYKPTVTSIDLRLAAFKDLNRATGEAKFLRMLSLVAEFNDGHLTDEYGDQFAHPFTWSLANALSRYDTISDERSATALDIVSIAASNNARFDASSKESYGYERKGIFEIAEMPSSPHKSEILQYYIDGDSFWWIATHRNSSILDVLVREGDTASIETVLKADGGAIRPKDERAFYRTIARSGDTELMDLAHESGMFFLSSKVDNDDHPIVYSLLSEFIDEMLTKSEPADWATIESFEAFVTRPDVAVFVPSASREYSLLRSALGVRGGGYTALVTPDRARTSARIVGLLGAAGASFDTFTHGLENKNAIGYVVQLGQLGVDAVEIKRDLLLAIARLPGFSLEKEGPVAMHNLAATANVNMFNLFEDVFFTGDYPGVETADFPMVDLLNAKTSITSNSSSSSWGRSFEDETPLHTLYRSDRSGQMKRAARDWMIEHGAEYLPNARNQQPQDVGSIH